MKKSSIAYGGNAKEEQQQRRKKSNYDGIRYNPLRNAVDCSKQESCGDDVIRYRGKLPNAGKQDVYRMAK